MNNLEEKKQWLDQAYRENKISKEYYDQELAKIDEEIILLQKTQSEQFINDLQKKNLILTFENGHLVTHLYAQNAKVEVS